MKQSPRPIANASKQTPTRQSAVMILIGTALDTTWRVFVPTIGGLFLGIWIDGVFHIAPIGVIVMILLGVVVSGLLIARQLKDVRKLQ